MDLNGAIDFLASNCPNVFKPICEELNSLREYKDSAENQINTFKDIIDELIMKGGK